MVKPDRVRELDFLRFIAALAVVLYHFSFRGAAADHLSTFGYPAIVPIAKYGYLGVNLFFIISGFVILMTASGATPKHFFISRAVRLYPAFWVCCTLTFLLTLVAGHGIFSAHVGQYLANMTLLAGFTTVPLIDGVYWSLVVEIQFYAFVFAILLIGRIDKAEGFLVAWLVATLLLLSWPVRHLSDILLVQFAPYFIAGATFFLVRQYGWTALRVGMLIVSFFASVSVAWTESGALEAHYHTAWSSTVIASVMAAFFAIFTLIASKRTSIFAGNGFIALGALTYPLYLIHQNVGFMLFNLLNGKVNPHVLMWGMVLAVLAVAFAVNRLVEKPHAKRLRALLERALAYKLPRIGLLRHFATAVTCAPVIGPAELPQDERMYVRTDAVASSESCDPHAGIIPL